MTYVSQASSLRKKQGIRVAYLSGEFGQAKILFDTKGGRDRLFAVLSTRFPHIKTYRGHEREAEDRVARRASKGDGAGGILLVGFLALVFVVIPAVLTFAAYAGVFCILIGLCEPQSSGHTEKQPT